MCNLGLGYLPIAFVTCFLVGLWTSYGLAVYFGSISPVWPYISDTGVDLPETCIFSLFFNISAFIALVIMFIRFRYIQNAVRDSDPKLRRLSKVNMAFGCISTFGFLLVANFPEYKTGLIHTVSAIIMFVTAGVYGLCDARVTSQMAPVWGPGPTLCCTRWILAIISCCGFTISILLPVWISRLPLLYDENSYAGKDAKLMECIHYIGAAHLFFFGNLYAVVDSYISDRVTGGRIVPVRISLVTVSICCMLGTGLVKIIHYIGAALLFFFANLYGVVDTYIGARVNVGRIMPVRFSLFVLSTCCMLEYQSQALHRANALVLLIASSIYVCLDSRLSLHLWPLWSHGVICLARILFTGLAIVCVIITFIAELIAWQQWETGDVQAGDTWMLYEPGQPGYTAHLVSAISEWLMAGFFLAYFLTYIHEFRYFTLDVQVRLTPSTVTQPLKVKSSRPPPSERTGLVNAQVAGKWNPTTENGITTGN